MISLSTFKSLLPARLLDRPAVSFSVNADNNVRLPGQTVFLCLLNGLLNHSTLTQRMLEEQYMKLTRRSCDHSSFGRRLASIDAGYFQAIFEHLYKKLDSLLYISKVELATFSSKWSRVKDLESMHILVIHCLRFDRHNKSWKPFVKFWLAEDVRFWTAYSLRHMQVRD